IESSMGMQSNLDDVRRKDLTAQCPAGLIVLSTRELLIAFAIFAVLSIVVVSMGDSDEDDILISSMYS
ncbi:hypothetical protein TELCIR_12588, partial [Teladorsagia circumcincta]